MTILELPCSGETHRVEIHNDGTAVMLDHNEKTLRAFMAFDSEVPPCFDVIDHLQACEEAYGDVVERCCPYLCKQAVQARRMRTLYLAGDFHGADVANMAVYDRQFAASNDCKVAYVVFAGSVKRLWRAIKELTS